MTLFHGLVMLPCILKTIWYMNTILWDYEWVWPDVWPQNICVTYISRSSDFALYLENYLIYEHHTLRLWVSMTSKYLCDLYFMVQWFCLISWKLFSGWTLYFGTMSQYDLMFDLKIFVCHCNLYFIIHWICLISWRLFDVWTSYFGIMSQYDWHLTLK